MIDHATIPRGISRVPAPGQGEDGLPAHRPPELTRRDLVLTARIGRRRALDALARRQVLQQLTPRPDCTF